MQELTQSLDNIDAIRHFQHLASRKTGNIKFFIPMVGFNVEASTQSLDYIDEMNFLAFCFNKKGNIKFFYNSDGLMQC